MSVTLRRMLTWAVLAAVTTLAACTPAPLRTPLPSVGVPAGCEQRALRATSTDDAPPVDMADLAGAAGSTPDEVVVVAVDDSGRPEIVTTPTAAASATVSSLESAGDVEVIALERDRPVWTLDTEATPAGVDATPAGGLDPFRREQWALDRFGVEGVWPRSTGADIDIAVIDTGVEAAHPDLAGRVCPGVSFVGSSGAAQPGSGGYDPNGHGTHVAGIAAAGAGDGIGIAGIAPDARILPVTVLDAAGHGTAADVGRGIVWAVDHGAEIVNVSLGGSWTASVEAAVDYAEDRGVLVVAAAGNAGTGGPAFYPAAIPDALAVGSFDRTGEISSFSTRGDYVDLAAPGSGIISASPGGSWALRSGTSMAAPHVSGTAALILALDPGLTPAALRARLESTAEDAGPIGRDLSFGEGRLDPAGALAG